MPKRKNGKLVQAVVNANAARQLGSKHGRRALAKRGAMLLAKRGGQALVGVVGWPVVFAIAAAAILLVVIVLLIFFVALFKGGGDATDMARYQCQSRLGASVGYTPSARIVANTATPSQRMVVPIQPPTIAGETATTARPRTTTAAATTTSPMPTANPYASISVDPSAAPEVRACLEALKTGELVAAPLTDTTASPTGLRMANAALLLAGGTVTGDDTAGSPSGPAGGKISPANLVRYAYARATTTGGAAPAASGSAAAPTTTTARPAAASASVSGRPLPAMPPTLAEQISIGDRVDPASIAPGDLVFYNFTGAEGPTAVMIATTATTGIDANTPGRAVALADLPKGNVVVKRVTTT